MPGPRNGIKIKRIDGSPRSCGLKVSLMTPGETARLGARAKPERKRRMQIPAKDLQNPAASVKISPIGVKRAKTGYRPTVSDSGPPTTGPRPSAATYVVSG